MVRVNSVSGIGGSGGESVINPMSNSEYKKLWGEYKAIYERTNWNNADLKSLSYLKIKMDAIESHISA